MGGWQAANPYGRGINWASALEVAFRALSWIWVYHLAGDAMDAGLRGAFSNRFTGMAAICSTIFRLFFTQHAPAGRSGGAARVGNTVPGFSACAHWKHEGGAIVRAQMEAQVRADGSHFEQSSYYHVYALDMLLFSAAIEKMPADTRRNSGPWQAIWTP